MEKLKNSIIKNFIFFAFGISVILSMIDSIFETLIFSKLQYSDTFMNISLVFYILSSLLVIVLFGFAFAKIIRKKINLEMNRQVNERNLLLANIVHDLKTPMTSILGFSQALKEGKVKEDEKQAIIDTIYQKTKKTDELLNLLFQYTKISTDQYQIRLEPRDICRLVRDCVAQTYELFEEKQMELNIDIPEKAIVRDIDSLEISRAVNNIILNAYRHNHNKAEVLIRVTEEQGRVLIEVADNGEDIPAEMKEKIFEPFICGDESRSSQGGSGLGLALAKRIVELHEGELYIIKLKSVYTKAFVIKI